jgi:hypothetical protein
MISGAVEAAKALIITTKKQRFEHEWNDNVELFQNI